MSLLDDLRAEGLKVVPGANWETHAAPGAFAPIGILNHWDAIRGWPGIELYRHSPRPELNHQPTYHIVIQRDGTVHLISQGHVYGAGGGDRAVYEAMRSDAETIPPARVQKSMGGNTYLWAVCFNYWPDGSPLTNAQYDAGIRVNAALCRRAQWSPLSRSNDHDGWTTRKDDLSGRPPENWDLDRFRNDVQTLIDQGEDMKIAEPDWAKAPVTRLLENGMFPGGRPRHEDESMWRTFVFLDRMDRSIRAAVKTGGITVAAVVADIIARLAN